MKLNFRQAVVLALAAILMHLLLIISQTGVGLVLISWQAESDPHLKTQIDGAFKTLQELSPDAGDDETESQKVLEACSPVLTRVPWFSLSLLSSIFTFTLVGFLAARWLNSTDWLGALPLLAIVGHSSPSMVCNDLVTWGVGSAELSPLQHGLILAVQLFCVYAWGALGLWLKRRTKSSKDSGQVTSG